MEQVNNANNGADMSSADLVANEPWYRPLWTQYIPAGGRSNGGSGATGSVSHPDNPSHIARQLQTVVERSNRLQQTVDQLRSDQRRPPQMQPPPMLPGTQSMNGHRNGKRDGGYSSRDGGNSNDRDKTVWVRNDRDPIKRHKNDGGGGRKKGLSRGNRR